MRINRWHLAAGWAAILPACLLAPTASAAAVPLGGGAGIVVDGSYCTLTTVGHDHTGDLVGFTAAHCGGPGAQVVAEGTNDPVGVVAANSDLDYAVIKFDPAKVTPTANFAGFAINGIGGDPEWHAAACKLGAATGDFCSRISSLPGPGPRMAMQGLFQPGDDGGPVTSDGLLIAMIIRGTYAPGALYDPRPINFTDMVKFSAILDAVNASGGLGAGFVPVPA